MTGDIRSVLQEHHAFYEVSPFYVAHRFNGRCAGDMVQGGFNVDVYGIRTEDDEAAAPPPEEYGLGWATLLELADKVGAHTPGSCCLDVIPLPSIAIIDGRDGAVEAMIRLRISHSRGPDEPAGVTEQRALEEIEQELESLGVRRRV